MNDHSHQQAEVHMSTEKLDTHIRREQIARAALGIVQSQGLKAMTIERIASVIGLVPSAIYRHFTNKDEVLDAVLDLIQEGLLSTVDEARKEARSRLESLRRLLMFLAQMIQEFPAILPRIVFSDEVLTGNSIRKKKVYLILKSYLNAIGKIFEEGQAAGEIRSDISPESLAVQFFGLFQPPAILFSLSNGGFDVL